jgi:pyruvate dehydrogenase (quinone)
MWSGAYGHRIYGSTIPARLGPGPALVDVVTERQELVMPPAINFEEAKNFGLFMTKAVLDGRLGQLINLADVNLRR